MDYAVDHRVHKGFSSSQRKRTPQDEIFAAMYRAYQRGMSFRQIAALYHRTDHQTIQHAFKVRGWKVREWTYRPLLIRKGIVFRPDNTGRFRSKQLNKYLHHVVWEEANGPIPIGSRIRHKDGDFGNNALENLECLPIAEILRRYNPFHNQFTPPEQRTPTERSWRIGMRRKEVEFTH